MEAEDSEQTTETDADAGGRFAAGINLHLSKIPIRIDFLMVLLPALDGR